MSSFSAEDASGIFDFIDADSAGEITKVQLQTYCSMNHINWSTVVTNLELHKRLSIKKDFWIKSAADGKLGTRQIITSRQTIILKAVP